VSRADRPDSFPITIRFKREEDPLYDEILNAPDARQYIKSRLRNTGQLQAIPMAKKDSFERIADSLEAIVDLLRNQPLQINTQGAPQSAEEEQHEPDLPGTDLSRRFSTLIGKALKTNDW
jgi:hypothetical protein